MRILITSSQKDVGEEVSRHQRNCEPLHMMSQIRSCVLTFRLEDNLKTSRQERQGAEQAGEEADQQVLPPEKSQGSSQGLFNLMPAPPVKN